MTASRTLRAIGLTLVLASALSCIRYQARPIEPAQAVEDFESRRLDSPELGAFLIANKEVET